MSLRQSIEIKESLSRLKALKKQQTSYKSIEKIRLLELLKSSPTLLRKVSAQELDISTRTQERWISDYLENGIEKFIQPQVNPKKSKEITPEIHEGLAKRVNSSTNCFRGYWDAYEWVKEEFGKEVQYANLRCYMIKHFGTKLKKPRKSHYKKDPVAVNDFLKKFQSYLDGSE